MATHAKVGDFSVEGHRESGDERQLILAALHEILESPPFRTSKQCQEMLQYVVEHSLAGNDAELRERVIGIQVFGRSRSYDTGEDPVVRVRAADVRKRLAQFYQQRGQHEAPVRIEVIPGAYRASFIWASAPSLAPAAESVTLPEARPNFQPELPVVQVPEPAVLSEPEQAQHDRFPRRALVLLIVLVVAAAACVLAWGARRLLFPADTALRQFWAPVMQSARPAFLYLGSNAAYRFSPEFLDSYRKSHNMENTGPEFFVELDPNQQVKATDLIPVRNSFVTVGDAAASAQIAALLARLKKPFDLRYATDISFGDLRGTPTVLIGGFNNSWTLEMTSELHYVLEQGDRIQERAAAGRTWSVGKTADGRTLDDYAIISRILHSKTGAVLMTAAGIGQYGTQASGEVLANPEKMAELLKAAPQGWQNKNMQIVLHIRVIDDTPTSTDVVATSVW